jgi:hypothetical protein
MDKQEIPHIWSGLLILAAASITLLILTPWPIPLPPAILIVLAAALNLYQIWAHLEVAAKFGWGACLEDGGHCIWGSADEQTSAGFLGATVFDYVGWILLFSLVKEPALIWRLIANAHLASGLLSVINHQMFQRIFIWRGRSNGIWTSHLLNWARFAFVLLDAAGRGWLLFSGLRMLAAP